MLLMPNARNITSRRPAITSPPWASKTAGPRTATPLLLRMTSSMILRTVVIVAWLLFAAAFFAPVSAQASAQPATDSPPQSSAHLPERDAAADSEHVDEKPAWQQEPRVLRVCADPNNLPFSNRRREGFENRLAELVADELDASVEYTWWAQRRGFLRSTLYDGKCDVVMGIPSSHDMVLATRAYYRSTYVFLHPADSDVAIESFDDPALKTLTIGAHLIGDDGTNTPPVHALTRRGMFENVEGYLIYGDYTEENPPARLVEAAASGDVDVAVVWGPLAGYFAPRQPVKMTMTPVSPTIDIPALPFIYSISMGVRFGDVALKSELDQVLHRRREDIAKILDEYGVPRR